jgi:hypothetical protein
MPKRPTKPVVDDGLAAVGLEFGQIVRYAGMSDKRYREGVVLRWE